MNGNKLLIVYSAVLTLAWAVSTMAPATANTQAAASKKVVEEINVQRINIREPDGTLRMVLSNSARTPGIFFRNVEKPHPSGRRSAGMLFFNDEGTENGGLSFGGRRAPDGSVSSGGHLSFDQYEQDQVIQLTQSESNGRRWAGMVVTDRPDAPLDFALAKKISEMPQGPERDAAIQKVQAEGTFGRQRVWVGKTRDKESVVLLSDAMARPRIRMRVAPDGASAIDFLDEKGQVLRSLTPQG